MDILRTLQQEPDHGYSLAEKLDLSHGYIYTHLRDLRKEKLIEVAEESDRKKYYRLTDRGEYLLKAFPE